MPPGGCCRLTCFLFGLVWFFTRRPCGCFGLCGAQTQIGGDFTERALCVLLYPPVHRAQLRKAWKGVSGARERGFSSWFSLILWLGTFTSAGRTLPMCRCPPTTPQSPGLGYGAGRGGGSSSALPSHAGMPCAALSVSVFPARQRPLHLQGADKPSKKKKKFISRKETQTQQPSSYLIGAARNKAPEGKINTRARQRAAVSPHHRLLLQAVAVGVLEKLPKIPGEARLPFPIHL